MSNALDVALLRTLLRYEPETGKLFWLPRPLALFEASKKKTAEQVCRWWNNRFAGAEAFTAQCGEGRHGKIFGQIYYAHRVIWALVTGVWPDQVDHEDGGRSNNRWKNLRNVDHQRNMQNKAVYRSSKSGFHGVVWHRRACRWQAYITINKKRRYLGYFDTQSGAVAARRRAEKEAGCFHANHGRRA